MCDTCGCGDSELVPVHVKASLLAKNAEDAAHNREHFRSNGLFAINLMGSPGSGKTALLEALSAELGGERLCAVSGDLATDNDGMRLRAAGIRALTITTGQACHLDARLVHHALHDLDARGAEYLVIENVGNLVCPAIYDLGQALNVVALSVTEGEDKPLKYPVMFQAAELVLLTKIDLLPHLTVSEAGFRAALERVHPHCPVLAVSGTTGQGIAELGAWLRGRRQAAGYFVPLHPNSHEHHGQSGPASSG